MIGLDFSLSKRYLDVDQNDVFEKYSRKELKFIGT